MVSASLGFGRKGNGAVSVENGCARNRHVIIVFYPCVMVGLQFGSHRKLLRQCETRRASLSGTTGSISHVPPDPPFLGNPKSQVGKSRACAPALFNTALFPIFLFIRFFFLTNIIAHINHASYVFLFCFVGLFVCFVHFTTHQYLLSLTIFSATYGLALVTLFGRKHAYGRLHTQ